MTFWCGYYLPWVTAEWMKKAMRKTNIPFTLAIFFFFFYIKKWKPVHITLFVWERNTWGTFESTVKKHTSAHYEVQKRTDWNIPESSLSQCGAQRVEKKGPPAAWPVGLKTPQTMGEKRRFRPLVLPRIIYEGKLAQHARIASEERAKPKDDIMNRASLREDMQRGCYIGLYGLFLERRETRDGTSEIMSSRGRA